MNEQKKKGSIIPVRCRDRKFKVSENLGHFFIITLESTASKPVFKFIIVGSLK